MEKVNDSDYKRYIHFLSVSKWSASDVNSVTMKSIDSSLREQKIKSGLPTGLVIDETSHLKKGLKSAMTDITSKNQFRKVEINKSYICRLDLYQFNVLK